MKGATHATGAVADQEEVKRFAAGLVNQVAPELVLHRVKEALSPSGIFFVVDFKFSSDIDKSIGNPFAPSTTGSAPCTA